MSVAQLIVALLLAVISMSLMLLSDELGSSLATNKEYNTQD